MPETARETVEPGDADFHLVIPCFKESGRLPAYLHELVGALAAATFRVQILVVDDGSGPREQDGLRTITTAADGPAVRVACACLPSNMGKGFAVRYGWNQAGSARWVAFADADGATPAYEVLRVFEAAYQADDVNRCYLGSRVKMLGRSVDRRWKRHVIGRLYATLVSNAIDASIYDSQCGFKVIPTPAFARISGLLREDRFAFDVELITALTSAGYTLEEVAIDWTDVPGSKVSLIRDSVRMLRSLFMIRSRKQRGEYHS